MFFQTCGFCPGQDVINVTTSQQVDHSDTPILFHLGRDPGEKFMIKWADNLKILIIKNNN